MGNYLMPKTHKRAERQGEMAKTVQAFMKKYDQSRTGRLSRAEVEALASDLLNEYTPLVGGLTQEDVDMIMACGGPTLKSEITAKDLPLALSVMASVKELNKEYHELFERFDKDKTGTLAANQLFGLLQEVNGEETPSESDVLFVLRKLEPRGVEDPITEVQLKAAVACWYCLRPSVQEEIKAMFQAWDTDGTGTISKNEFTIVMKGLNCGFNDAQVSRLFIVADRGCTGVLDYDEFVDFLWQTKLPVGSGVPASSPNADRPNTGAWSSGGMLRAKGRAMAAQFYEPPAANPTEDEKKKLQWSSGGFFWGGART